MERSSSSAAVLAISLLLAGVPTLAPAQETGPPPYAPGAPAPAAPPQGGGAAQNPFLGGVPAGSPEPGVLRLTLQDAVERGLRQNLGAILGEQDLRAATAGKELARGGLLPSFSAGLTGIRQVINLAAYGFPAPPGQSSLVGPFNVIDARAYLVQPILDMAAIRRMQAGAHGLDAAQFSYQDTREMVVLTCAGLYLQGALGSSRIEAARAQEEVARALHDRAVSLRSSGVVPGIEVLRADVQLRAQEQRVIFLENEYAKEKLALARTVGLPLSQEFELAEKLVYDPAPPPEVGPAMEEATRARPDLREAEAAVAAAESVKQADFSDHLPTIRFSADYGYIGTNSTSMEQTYTAVAGLRIPIYQGGQISARVLQDDAELTKLKARRDDLKGRLELEVRSALLDLQAADLRVKVAKEAADLAGEQLRQSQDRFAAGVTGNLEVVQAQDAVALASDNYLSALYAHNLARLALAHARGAAESSMPTFLAGEKGSQHD